VTTRPRLNRTTVLRAFFAVSEQLAPAVGARLADRIWFTVPPVPRAASREPADLPPYAPFSVDVDGRTVRGRAYGRGPAVVLVHGWGGWGMQLAASIGPLVAAGHRVITYDALSHGSSDPGPAGPKRSSVMEFVSALEAVVAASGPPVAVIAHSLGAMAVARAIKDGLSVDRVVFLAPSQHPGQVAFSLGALLGFGPRVRRRLLDRVERRVGERLDDYDAAAVGRTGRTPPVLVVHDRSDEHTPYEGSVEIAECWPNATLVSTEGLGHFRILRDPGVVADAVTFVLEPDGPVGTRTPRPSSGRGILTAQVMTR
jgi:pimeloyl-ACP methyl ester carboxylesterase